MDRLLTTQEVAEVLGVEVNTLYAWRYRGEGPPGIRIGKYLRFRRADLEEWIAGQERLAPRSAP